MNKIYFTTIRSFFFVLMLAGCSPTVAPSGNVELPSNSQNYRVEIINLTEPVYETVRTENIDQPNCNGTGDVDNVVERTMGINHSIELGLGLTVDIDGKLELFGTGVDLGAAISNELGYQYGITESISRSITVRAAPKTHVIHTVKLSEVWESGTARVSSNGESIDIPFRFRANFSIDLLESIPVDCETGQISATQSVVEPIIQPTAIPQNPSSGVCQEAGGASGFSLSQSPSAPANGCVLIVEWWVPPDSANCGILITTSNPIIPDGSVGAWWYVYPQRPDSHKQEFLAKNPHCKVEDFR